MGSHTRPRVGTSTSCDVGLYQSRLMSTGLPASMPPRGFTGISLDGDDFFEADEVLFGTLVLTEGTVGGFTIQNDATISFVAPDVTALGPVSISVQGPGGVSAATSIQVVVADPPVFQVPPLILTQSDTSATWRFAGSPSATAWFLVGLAANSFQFQGFSVLNTPLPIINIPLNGAGVGTIVAPIDPSLGGVGFFTIFSQVVFFDPTIDATTPIASTLVL